MNSTYILYWKHQTYETPKIFFILSIYMFSWMKVQYECNLVIFWDKSLEQVFVLQTIKPHHDRFQSKFYSTLNITCHTMWDDVLKLKAGCWFHSIFSYQFLFMEKIFTYLGINWIVEINYSRKPQVVSLWCHHTSLIT